jgi:crotonobetainyl-CoA:carnitine CoA-transferase CaiB-like acyl-CoA transferase
MTTPPLSDYVIVDLSTGIAGAYCTKLLADGGATVIKVEPPGGDPLRRWSASGATIPVGGDGALFSFLSSSKESVVVDPAGELAQVIDLLAGADAVVWSKGSVLAELAALSPDAIGQAAPHLTVTTITPFGTDGPWCDRAATELTLQAWSGAVVGLGRGAPDRAPIFVGGQIGEWLTGTYAAIGTIVSLGRTDPGGETVDVSMLEVLALSMTYYPVTFADMVGRPFRTGRSIVTPGVEATSDGLVGVGVGTGQQWLDFCVMVDHPEWMEDRKLFANRGHLAPEIATWMAQHTTDEVLEIAGTWRIPHAPIGNGATIATTDHFEARRSIVKNARDGFDEPDRPYRFDPPLLATPRPAPRLDEHSPTNFGGSGPDAGAGSSLQSSHRDPATDDPPPLAGLRVLDLTAFCAGPLCTHVLALLGAEVLHIESPARPDGTRMLPGIRFSEPNWWEQSGIFSGLNTNKLGVTLDLASNRGRELLADLLDTCDVLVENYTPRVLEQIGLDIGALRAERPDLIVVRMPGFGLDGPWRDNPAFAFVIEDAAGLTWLTGHPDQNPVSPYAVGDSNAGLHALCGLLLALEHRRATGEGALVEAAMVDAALNVAAEQVVEHSAYDSLLERDGNRGPAAAPQNLYRAADVDDAGKHDAWVAIAIATDQQWGALADAIGAPTWATDPSLSTGSARRERHDEIDEHLASWCAERTGDQIVECLWGAGIPVAKVMQPHQQATLPQLQARGFFEDVDHPVAGTARHSTLPIRFSRGPERFHLRHAPLLGEHTDAVLREVGVSEDELVQLDADGVIGRAPAGR